MFLRKPNPAPQPLLLGSLLTLSALSALGTMPAASAAGTLDAPAPPASGSSAMYNINDVCNRLDSGAAGSTRSGAFSEPASGPAASNCTLNDVMAKAPAVDASAAAAGEVADGKTYWSLKDGVWGKHTGTATAGANVTGTDGSLGITIPDGLYSGGKTATASDTDLTAANIKSGVNLFGVEGTHAGIGGNVQDTSSGDATAPEIASGKKAWVDGSEVTGTGTIATGDATAAHVLTGKTFSNASGAGISGTMADKEGDNASTSQSAAAGVNKLVAPTGFYDGDDTVTATDAQVAALDSDIAAANIKSGTTIFGITGTLASKPEPTCDCSGGTIHDAANGGTRWCDNGDGTVTDLLGNSTNYNSGKCLVWLKNAKCTGTLNSIANASNALPWLDAIRWSTGLQDGQCGLSDSSGEGMWRLPTKEELVGVAQGTEAISSGTPRAFSSVHTFNYWSSSTYAVRTGEAWFLGLHNGFVSVNDKTINYYVWPVRGGQ